MKAKTGPKPKPEAERVAKLHISLPPDVAKELRHRADLSGKSLSEIITHALNEYYFTAE